MGVRRFTVITPCFNARRLIGPTIESILGQRAVRSGRVALEYIVCDGASRDGTVELVADVCREKVRIISEPDAGMYDALAKGLRVASGDVISYLNAGDVYHPSAFDVVADVLDTRDVTWVTGMRVACNERLEVINAAFPYRYRRDHIRRGIYGFLAPTFIQQESTFWTKSLNGLIDCDQLARFRLAGDFFLWKTFAQYSDLTIVHSYLGGFTHHAGQQSAGLTAYLDEMRGIAEPYGPWDALVGYVDRAISLLAPPRIKKALNPRQVLRYDLSRGEWR